MIENLIQPIQTAYANGQFDHAGLLCDQALSAHPDSGRLHNLAAAIAAKNERLDDARRHAERARELAPDNLSFHLNAALIHERAGQLDDAVAANESVLGLDDGHATALANLANLARLQHQDDKALNLYAKAGRAAPNDTTILANWASLLSLNGQHDEGLQKIERALTLEPGDADLLACHADLLGAAGRYADAIDVYSTALAAMPDQAQTTTLANKAVTQLKARQQRDALHTAAALDALDPGNRTAAAVRYISAAQTGDRQQAEQEMDVARYLAQHGDQFPDHYPSCEAFAKALRGEVLAHPSLAFEPASKTTRGGLQSANLVPDAGPAICALHELLLKQVYAYLDTRDGATLTAASALQHAQLNIWVTVLNEGGRQLPHIHPAGVLSGVFYVDVPDSEGGAIEFGQPPEDYAPFGEFPRHQIPPRQGDLLIFPSQFYHRTLPFAHREPRISIAFDVIPCAHDADVPSAAIRALDHARQRLAARDIAGAASVLAQLNERVPDYAHAWLVAGQLSLQTGNHDAAITQLVRATTLRPRIALWWYQRAVAHQRLLDYPAAHAALARCLSLDPHHEPALMTLASLHTDNGEADQALAVYRRIVTSRPGAGRAWYGLALQRVASLDADDIGAMRAALASGATDAGDTSGLHFALGRALEHATRYDDAFTHFAAGNRIKRDAQPFDTAAERRNAAAISDAFTPAVFEHFRTSGFASDTPVLIVGMPRSGSTLTEQILASHPQVAGAGETNALWRTLSQLGRHLPPNKTLPRDVLTVPSNAWRELGERYVDALRREAGQDAARITDKLPFNYTLLGMLRLMLPDAYIIDARRHPMDTCWSCFATSFGVDRGFTNDLNDLGVAYRSYDQLMSHWHRVLEKPIYTAQYEAMIRDSEGQSRALIEYLGLDWHDDCLNFHQHERAVTTSSYAQVRQPIYASSVARWRHFEPHLEPLRTALGPSLDAYKETNP